MAFGPDWIVFLVVAPHCACVWTLFSWCGCQFTRHDSTKYNTQKHMPWDWSECRKFRIWFSLFLEALQLSAISMNPYIDWGGSQGTYDNDGHRAGAGWLQLVHVLVLGHFPGSGVRIFYLFFTMLLAIILVLTYMLVKRRSMIVYSTYCENVVFTLSGPIFLPANIVMLAPMVCNYESDGSMTVAWDGKTSCWDKNFQENTASWIMPIVGVIAFLVYNSFVTGFTIKMKRAAGYTPTFAEMIEFRWKGRFQVFYNQSRVLLAFVYVFFLPKGVGARYFGLCINFILINMIVLAALISKPCTFQKVNFWRFVSLATALVPALLAFVASYPHDIPIGYLRDFWLFYPILFLHWCCCISCGCCYHIRKYGRRKRSRKDSTLNREQKLMFIFSKYDTDSNGTIERQEFEKFLTDLRKWLLFRKTEERMVTDGAANMTKKHLKKAQDSAKVMDLAQSTWDEILDSDYLFKKMDKSGDENVELDEFIQFCSEDCGLRNASVHDFETFLYFFLSSKELRQQSSMGVRAIDRRISVVLRDRHMDEVLQLRQEGEHRRASILEFSEKKRVRSLKEMRNAEMILAKLDDEGPSNLEKGEQGDNHSEHSSNKSDFEDAFSPNRSPRPPSKASPKPSMPSSTPRIQTATRGSIPHYLPQLPIESTPTRSPRRARASNTSNWTLSSVTSTP